MLRNGVTVTATTDAEKCSLPFSHWSEKSIRTRSSGHSVSIKSMYRTITMQGLTVTATTDAEKCSSPFKRFENIMENGTFAPTGANVPFFIIF